MFKPSCILISILALSINVPFNTSKAHQVEVTRQPLLVPRSRRLSQHLGSKTQTQDDIARLLASYLIYIYHNCCLVSSLALGTYYRYFCKG